MEKSILAANLFENAQKDRKQGDLVKIFHLFCPFHIC